MLKGMPIQTFTMTTAIFWASGVPSQSWAGRPSAVMISLKTPYWEFSISRQAKTPMNEGDGPGQDQHGAVETAEADLAVEQHREAHADAHLEGHAGHRPVTTVHSSGGTSPAVGSQSTVPVVVEADGVGRWRVVECWTCG